MTADQRAELIASARDYVDRNERQLMTSHHSAWSGYITQLADALEQVLATPPALHADLSRLETEARGALERAEQRMLRVLDREFTGNDQAVLLEGVRDIAAALATLGHRESGEA